MTGAGDAAKEYAAGCAAGIAQVAVGHPFDTVKVKLQAHNTTAHGKVYRNAFHCTRRILVEEGVLDQVVALQYVPSDLQVADFFTKAYTRAQHR